MGFPTSWKQLKHSPDSREWMLWWNMALMHTCFEQTYNCNSWGQEFTLGIYSTRLARPPIKTGWGNYVLYIVCKVFIVGRLLLHSLNLRGLPCTVRTFQILWLQCGGAQVVVTCISNSQRLWKVLSWICVIEISQEEPQGKFFGGNRLKNRSNDQNGCKQWKWPNSQDIDTGPRNVTYSVKSAEVSVSMSGSK